MAAFVIGKSLKDRRQTKAIEELFDKADKNGNGKISVEEYVQIFQEHGIELSPDEVGKVHYTLCYINSGCFFSDEVSEKYLCRNWKKFLCSHQHM